MSYSKYILGFILCVTSIISCQKKIENNILQDSIKDNDLGIDLRLENDKGIELEEISTGDSGEVYYKISVDKEFALRGKVSIEPNQSYKLSVTMKNESSNPLVLYSFWKGLVTSVRNFTLAGENGNPPVSETQKVSPDWVTFEETFQAQEGEDSFMLSLVSKAGTFYIKEIQIVALE